NKGWQNINKSWRPWNNIKAASKQRKTTDANRTQYAGGLAFKAGGLAFQSHRCRAGVLLNAGPLFSKVGCLASKLPQWFARFIFVSVPPSLEGFVPESA